MSDSDLAKLNKYMGGTGDAEEFLTPIDGNSMSRPPKQGNLNDSNSEVELLIELTLPDIEDQTAIIWRTKLGDIEYRFLRIQTPELSHHAPSLFDIEDKDVKPALRNCTYKIARYIHAGFTDRKGE